MSSNYTDHHHFDRDHRDFQFEYHDAGFNDTHEDAPLISRRLPRRQSSSGGPGCCFCACFLGCFGFLAIIGLSVLAFWYFLLAGGVPLMVSPETTVIVEPLKADGMVDFHQAINNKFEHIRPNENGFRDVLLAFGREMFALPGNENDADWQYLAMRSELGIDLPIVPPRFTIRNPHEPRMMEFCQEGLDAVRYALNRPHYYMPLVRQSERDLVVLSSPAAVYVFHRHLADAFRARAAERFNAGATEEAWKDTLATIRLFRFVAIHEAWRDAARGANVERSLTPVSEVVGTFQRWTPEQLQQAIRDLESLPGWQDRQTTLQVMQFQLLDIISTAHDLPDLFHRIGGAHQVPPQMLQLMGTLFISFDWNITAIELNREIERYMGFLQEMEASAPEEMFRNLRPREMPRLPEDDDMWEMLRFQRETGLDTLGIPIISERSQNAGFLAGELVRWATGEMFRLQLIEESRTQALRLALALELYHREHERYPALLDELGVPVDMQFEYERIGETYRLCNGVFRFEM